MTRPSDGRRLRGAARKRSLIAATLAVIEREGVAGVTHRAVGQQAGVQPSLVAYHFATLDDLLVAALSGAAEDYAAGYTALREAGSDALDALAQLVADAAGPGRARAIAERELTLLAARRPALRPIASHWRDLVTEAVAGYTSDAQAVDAVVATSDGLCTAILLADENTPPSVGRIRAMLSRALTTDVAPGPDTPPAP